jgi:hypothetical protein
LLFSNYRFHQSPKLDIEKYIFGLVCFTSASYSTHRYKFKKLSCIQQFCHVFNLWKVKVLQKPKKGWSDSPRLSKQVLLCQWNKVMTYLWHCLILNKYSVMSVNLINESGENVTAFWQWSISILAFKWNNCVKIEKP